LDERRRVLDELGDVGFGRVFEAEAGRNIFLYRIDMPIKKIGVSLVNVVV
jgi:hypothetical protein